MEVESSFSSIAPLVFDGDNYRFWAIRMKTHLDVMDLWEAVEEDYEIIPLPSNPTMAQIKHHKERKIRKSKINEGDLDYLKTEYEEDERIEDCKLLGSSLLDSRIVEKILVTVLERFEASITALENTKDLSMIILAELLNALQAQEQRRVIRQDGVIEGALLVKHHVNAINNRNKKALWWKKSHPHFKCWKRLDAKCTKCYQMGHEVVIYKNKKQQHGEKAQVADQEDDKLFMATCFSSMESSESWLIDSGFSNHMTHDKDLFKELRSTNTSKVRIGNGQYITMEGKGTVAI
ncbi:hypothetical protein CK203_045518 [Vitis vinifera]|uniref:Uncharacterized protein n=1 Tax=Vitis vinifera TaxID=29760 RepID=A0A438HY60_VITVI|nr:hypothetical protein CK203_045518 [Vitis vinifera]